MEFKSEEFLRKVEKRLKIETTIMVLNKMIYMLKNKVAIAKKIADNILMSLIVNLRTFY
jgi:hypothetical protein